MMISEYQLFQAMSKCR